MSEEDVFAREGARFLLSRGVRDLRTAVIACFLNLPLPEGTMSALRDRRQLQGFVAMPDEYPQASRVRELLTQVVSELSDCKLDLVFAHDKLPTHFLLRKNLHGLVARADFVLCVTDGEDPGVSFESGLAFGLEKPLLFVVLPKTRRLPATLMGHFYVELSGDASDHDRLKSAIASFVAFRSGRLRAGRSRSLSRMGCGVAASNN